MTDVSKLLNGTSAGFIARQLDAKDGEQDGKIKASIWNDFIKDIGTGKEISEFITTENAMKSITAYVIRQAKNSEKNIAELAKEWSNKIGNAADVKPAEETSNPEEVDNEEVVENPEVETVTQEARDQQIKADIQNMKVDAFADIKWLFDARKDGKKIADGMKSLPRTAILEKLQTEVDKDNIAYVLNNFPQLLNLDYNRRILRKCILTPLLTKAESYGIETKTIDEYKKMNNKELKTAILGLKNEIIKCDNATVTDRNKAQKTFNDANKFIAEVANMEPKPVIWLGENDDYYIKYVEIDGKFINLYYSKDTNKIISIDVNYDKSRDSDKSNYVEISYSTGNTYYNYDHSNGFIKQGHNFDAIKKVVEKIFGKIDTFFNED